LPKPNELVTQTNGEANGGLVARPTLRHVAALAGVSFKTVSRVVNGEPGVRPATAARVSDAVRQLGFRRNEIASSLKRSGRRQTIGLVIEDMANPFFSTIARAVEEVARDRGLMLITASSDEDCERERQVIDSLVERRVDGLLVVPAGRDHSFLSQEIDMGVAVVFVDRPPGQLRADCVLLDNVGGARRAVEHLLAYGHRRIAVLGDRPDVFTIAERYDGYRAAIEAAGIAVDPALVRLSLRGTEDARAEVNKLLELPSPPTALFAINNRMAIGAVQALAVHGDHVGLVGFDDFELAGFVSPPVSVVTYDTQAMGRQAAELLLRRMDGDRGPARRVILRTWVVPRGSGELRAV
jgi:LacI family transcriptional regulator